MTDETQMSSYVATQMELMSRRTANDDESLMVRYLAKHFAEVAKRGPWHLAAEVEIFVHSNPVDAMAAIELLRPVEPEVPDGS